ncbi:MAG TPA: TIGR03118 family protein [Conexibacter sp.]|nr:TIGR03118 family protein [Conexibacter sp.]
MLALVAALALVVPAAAAGHGHGQGRGHAFEQRNLVSDIAGVARVTDRNLVNSWGMAAGPSTPLWVADNGSNVSTLYSGAVNGAIPVVSPLVVGIPNGAPTGIVFNPTNGFTIGSGATSGPARFIFDSEAGTITAWSPSLSPATQAQLIASDPSAVYKGLALATSHKRGTRIYAADFHGAKIDVWNDQFRPVNVPGAFTDRGIPAGFAPFNVQALGGLLYVTYAKQDADAHDDVAGPGNGFVDVYDKGGHLLGRLVSQGQLNSPWGLAIAPRHFGRFGGDLLVGNFGDGKINVYDPRNGRFQGQLVNQDGNAIQIDGLWALRFGNGTFGTPDGLLFTAGIGDEGHGLLGEIVAR